MMYIIKCTAAGLPFALNTHGKTNIDNTAQQIDISGVGAKNIIVS